MARKKRVKAAPFTGWIFLGFGVALLAVAAVYVGLAIIPWSIFSSDSGPPSPPERLDLPLVSTVLGWSVVLGCVGFAALALRLDHGRERRVEPLAMIALCLAALGHAEAISGANAMASHSGAWPVNLIEVAIWLLLAAAGVGVLAWIRILISKQPVRGRILASCALACSLGTAWFVNLNLVDHYGNPPTSEDGIEVPVAYHSSLDQPWPGEPRPEVLVESDGTISHGPLEELAKSMPQIHGRPDCPILIRAHRDARWSAVRQALLEVQEARFWKVQLATRWKEPEAATKIAVYLPGEIVDVEDAEPPPPPYVLRVSAKGPLLLEGEPFEDRDALHARMEELYRRRQKNQILRIEVDEEARWGDVVAALSAARHSFQEIRLGPFSCELG